MSDTYKFKQEEVKIKRATRKMDKLIKQTKRELADWNIDEFYND